MSKEKDELAQIVEDHRREAVKAEEELKESFYLWESAFFMKYLPSELGGQRAQDRQGKSTQYVGYLHAQIETAVSRIMGIVFRQDSPFEVEPTGGQTMQQAKAIQALHVHSMRETKAKQILRQMLRYVFIYGTCPVKHYWDERWIKKGTLKPVMTGVDESGRKTWDYEKTEKDLLLYAGPNSSVVDPYCFHVSPRAENVEDARWVQEEFIRDREHVEKLIESGTYDAVDWDKVDPHVGDPVGHFDYQDRRRDTLGTPVRTPSEGEGDDITPPLYDLVEEWRNDRVITIIGRGNPQVLRDRPNPFAHGQKPYTIFRYIDLANEFWGIPMARQLEGPQSELNLVRRLRSDAVKQQLKPMWRMSPMAATGFSDDDLEWRPNGIIEAEKNDIEPLNNGPLPIFSYKEEEILRQDGDLISGITDIVRGQVPSSQTATGSSISSNFAIERLSLISDSVCEELEHMMGMRHKLYQQFSTEDQVVRSVGEEGLHPITVPLEMIAGDYSFHFRTGRSLGQRELFRNQFMQAMTVVSQNPMLAQITNFVDLLRDFWAQFDMPNTGRYVIAPDDMGNSQQAEILVMTAGEPVAVRPNDNHMEHYQFIQQFKQSPEYQIMPPEVRKLIEEHEQKHLPYVMAQQQTAQTPDGLQSPERANVNATASTAGEVLSDNNRFSAPKVRTQ